MNVSKKILFSTLLGGLFLSLELSARTPIILIDPGHGGDDCGAKSYIKAKEREVCEKELALEISLKINKLLKKNFQSYLTRTMDRTISLDDRAQMADKVAADYFISIHLNAHENPHAKGLEVYYLDNHNNIAVHKIERVENKDLKGEIVVINQILADLVIERTAPVSKGLAQSIHKGLVSSVKKAFAQSDRGPKAALFYVLALSKRPSVLLEAGFMTHLQERELMADPRFQDKFAEGVANGITAYVKKNYKF
ncbi:MAG: hypothetical protein A2X86_06950 [Bdellovibrionales bacterium GWA2_49_15]|nr:MAG: hypothetical protein A2X86_06950 [Bdellovibrionales bacterium GWA2_49_15]HAZ11987.1 hypothetical protein [Bdellovibrionales bacterium]